MPKAMKKMKRSFGETVADAFIYIAIFIAGAITIYPFIFLLSCSISDPMEVLKMHVWLWPKGFTLHSFYLLTKSNTLWLAYYNTIWYTVVGIVVNVVMAVTFAFPLSRKDFFARSAIMLFMAVPMFVGGSVNMIPSFILVNALGLFNTRWAIIIPSAMSPMLAIMSRIFFQTTIPDSLIESARIDGANEVRILRKIVLPLSLPIVSVLVIYNVVIFWNVYTAALLYVPNFKLAPLQVYLQQVLIKDTVDAGAIMGSNPASRGPIANQLKYSSIVVSILPIVAMYPFLQKYFVQGSMMGAIKE
jgi:putative aldouronate transport system permease protein